MKADIISIGDELLIGQTVNTNASWLGKELGSRGIRIMQVTAIPDDEDDVGGRQAARSGQLERSRAQDFSKGDQGGIVEH